MRGIENKYQIKSLGIQTSQDSSYQCDKCKRNIPVGQAVYLVSRVDKEKKELRDECYVK